MPLSAMYEARLINKPRKSAGGPQGVRRSGSHRETSATATGRGTRDRSSSGAITEEMRQTRTASPLAAGSSRLNGNASSSSSSFLAGSSTAPHLASVASGSGTGGAPDKPKKKRKKFKGYAMVIEDDYGNVIEERPWGELTPEPEPQIIALPPAPAAPPASAPPQDHEPSSINVKEPELRDDTDGMEVDELDEDDDEAIADREADMDVALMSRSTSARGGTAAASAAAESDRIRVAPYPGAKRASSRRGSTSSRLSELTMPLSEIESVSPGPSRGRSNGDGHKRALQDSSSPLPDDLDTPAPDLSSDQEVPLITRRTKPPKKRRKTTPASSPEYAPNRPGSAAASSRIHSSTSHAATSKQHHKKPTRLSLPVGTLGTARSLANAAAARERVVQAKSAKEIRESGPLGVAPPPSARSARQTSAIPSVIHAAAPPPPPPTTREDEPGLPAVPRTGMGDGFPSPPESDLRSEAMFLIEAARKKRQEREKLEMAEQKRLDKEGRAAIRQSRPNGLSSRVQDGLTPPPSGETHTRGPYSRPRVNGDLTDDDNDDEDDDHDDPFAASNARSSARRPDRPPFAPHAQSLDFDAEFTAIQQEYENRGTIEQAGMLTTLERADDPRPPKFHPGQRPTVVLAPPTQGPGSLPVRRVKDKIEREHSEGYEGLLPEHEADLRRFADNVRTNLVEMADWYFPLPGARRDALLEAAGRLLSDFGYNLTADGDGALQRPLLTARPTNED